MRTVWLKRVVYFLLFFAIVLVLLYGAMWLLSRKTYPVRYGISFNQNHASSLGLDWKQVYTAMLTELRPPYIRIAAMWSDVEAQRGSYWFENVDWMMQEAQKYDTKVILVIGQKAPRWPECHVPGWYEDLTTDQAEQALQTYITQTVSRYQNHRALEFWQVENEPFIRFAFGDCSGYNKAFVANEVSLVRELDAHHPIILTDSGELGSWKEAASLGDYFGTTMYRIIRLQNDSIFRYDWVLPAGWFRIKARIAGVDNERFFVSELQAEPWFTDSNPMDTPVTIQEETMSPERLKKHMDFVTHIGASRAYLWGVEWWYFMKEQRGDERYWNLVQEYIREK